jgi:hypothetical protein
MRFFRLPETTVHAPPEIPLCRFPFMEPLPFFATFLGRSWTALSFFSQPYKVLISVVSISTSSSRLRELLISRIHYDSAFGSMSDLTCIFFWRPNINCRRLKYDDALC